jgi:8-oxo-dGTP pyrophosphatase MutT (NUDIX family)
MSYDDRVTRRDPDEKAFLAGYDPRAYPAVAVTVDMVILTVLRGQLSVLLIRRGNHPHRGRWALPGGFIEERETLDEAARPTPAATRACGWSRSPTWP